MKLTWNTIFVLVINSSINSLIYGLLSPKFRLTARTKARQWGCYKFSEQNYNSEVELFLAPENPNPVTPELMEIQEESNMKIEVSIPNYQIQKSWFVTWGLELLNWNFRGYCKNSLILLLGNFSSKVWRNFSMLSIFRISNFTEDMYVFSAQILFKGKTTKER